MRRQVEKTGLVSWILVSAMVGSACTTDSPTSPPNAGPSKQYATLPLSSLAANEITQALAGRQARGMQEDMLRVEAAFPGFAGFYVDSSNRVILLTRASGDRDENLRQSLSSM